MKKLLFLIGIGVWTALTVWISLTAVIFYFPDNLNQDRAVSSCFEAHKMIDENRAIWRHFIHRDGGGIEVLLSYEGGSGKIKNSYRVCRFNSDMKLLWKIPEETS
jgi:hypothetical protein